MTVERHADIFKRMKAKKDGQPPPAEAQPHLNDNAPFNAKEWRKNYMRLYMRAKRQRLREAKERK
jgi:hypothetical protein